VKHLLAALLASVAFGAAAETLDRTPLQAVTASGETVLLFPSGHWEFADTDKAAAARKSAAQYPENRTRPIDAQGGWFGGRVIMPGDPDYNRGSLGPKGR
jgi:hypothetical protein